MIRKNPPKNNSVFEDLSIVETMVMILIPIALTFLDYIIIRDMFNFKWWVCLIISSVSTVCLIWLISVLVTWLMERD